MIAVYNFHDASGQIVGLGTALELEYWSAQGPMAGYRLGKRIGWEHPREDQKRKAAWGRI